MDQCTHRSVYTWSIYSIPVRTRSDDVITATFGKRMWQKQYCWLLPIRLPDYSSDFSSRQCCRAVRQQRRWLLHLLHQGRSRLQSAVPIIMGANIGTTITSTIVSLGFISKKKEFRRAVAAGTYHDFFNILTAAILFPLEYYYGFLSSISVWIADLFFTPAD